jgi:hypothetical protein
MAAMGETSPVCGSSAAQGVEQVFDPKYVPATTEDIELFNEKQKFGYQVLKQTVQTQEGMTIVPEYSKTKDAQSMHAKLMERCEHSQATTLAQDALERELGELRLDATWKKGCAPFMVAFKNRVMDLENYTSPPSGDKSELKSRMQKSDGQRNQVCNFQTWTGN